VVIVDHRNVESAALLQEPEVAVLVGVEIGQAHEMAPRSSPQARTRHRLPAGAKYEKVANRITQASEKWRRRVRCDPSSRGVNLVFAAPFLSCSRSLCFRCQRFAIASCLSSTTHGNAAM
jgi:hypothetical protein